MNVKEKEQQFLDVLHKAEKDLLDKLHACREVIKAYESGQWSFIDPEVVSISARTTITLQPEQVGREYNYQPKFENHLYPKVSQTIFNLFKNNSDNRYTKRDVLTEVMSNHPTLDLDILRRYVSSRMNHTNLLSTRMPIVRIRQGQYQWIKRIE